MIVNDLEKLNLFIDCVPCHTTALVKSEFEAAGVDLTYIPKRLTNLLQSADISWFKPLKGLYKECWNNWS